MSWWKALFFVLRVSRDSARIPGAASAPDWRNTCIHPFGDRNTCIILIVFNHHSLCGTGTPPSKSRLLRCALLGVLPMTLMLSSPRAFLFHLRSFGSSRLSVSTSHVSHRDVITERSIRSPRSAHRDNSVVGMQPPWSLARIFGSGSSHFSYWCDIGHWSTKG